jgi:phosphoketolase
MSNERASDASYHAALSGDELRRIDALWRACNHLSVGMIYLRDNPLLREPLKVENVKHRLLGHWGASPALSFVWDIGSHLTPETPGSIHEGGELGHGYPWLIHKLAYRFRNHENLHVRGYTEKGNINTPPELAILNKVLDVLDRVPRLQGRTAHLREDMRNAIVLNMNFAHEHGTDSPEISEWVWPYWRVRSRRRASLARTARIELFQASVKSIRSRGNESSRTSPASRVVRAAFGRAGAAR